MRDRVADRCPKCEGVMRQAGGRWRTVRGGTWVDVYCPRCLLRKDRLVPRRYNVT